MSKPNATPRKIWFTPLPAPESPMDGGCLLHILPREGERLTVGLDLGRMLKLQQAMAHLIELVVTHSVKPQPKPVENPITEEEIAAAGSLIDDELLTFLNTPEKKDENE